MMKQSFGVVVGVCLLIAGSAGAETKPPSAQGQIEAVMAGMAGAAKAHDTDHFMAAYRRSPELVFAINGRVIQGWDALHAQQLKWWRNGKSDVAYTQIGPTVFTQLAPDVWVSTQSMSSRRTGSDGKAATGTFAITDIWQKSAHGWQIVYGHESWAKPPG